MNGDKSKKRTKSQKSKEPKKAKTNDEMVTVDVVESSELNEAMNHIFSLPDNGKSTGENLLQSMEKIGALEESLNEEAKKQARFRQLMDFYKKQPMQVDMIVTQDWLEKTYGHLVPPNSTAPELATPQPSNSPLDPYSPVSLPPVTQTDPIEKLMQEITQEERDKANADFINQGILPCPFHPCENVNCLNPDAEFGALYYRCPYPNCCVWFTSETYGIVLDVLQNITNKKLLPLFQDASLRCECNLVPNMELSKSEKNHNKVFLCCGNKNKDEKCGYFQFTHWSPWKPKRPSQPTMDDFMYRPPQQQNQTKYRPPPNRLNGWPRPIPFSPEREEPITRRKPLKEDYFRKSYNSSNHMVPWSVHGKPHLFGSYKKEPSNHMVPVIDDDDDDDDVGWFGSER